MANVGDKFIIELDSKMTNHNGFVYGVKDIPGLYVNDEIISHLKTYEDKTETTDNLEEILKAQNKNTEKILTVMQENYFHECGMKEAVDCILKIYLSPENGGYSKDTLKKIFCESAFSSIISDFSIMEIVEKMKLYEEQNKEKKEFRLWDEVTELTHKDTKFIIVDIGGNYITGLYENGLISAHRRYWKKTGRNFPQIAEILKEMRCENE